MTAHKRKITALVPKLLEWFSASARILPWRGVRDPYAVWVSEIMLQQTQVVTVIPFYERWMREVPDLKTLSELPEERLLKLWEGLGYYSRVRNMQKAARKIMNAHRGKFPSRYEEVLDLPGVGRYTAGAICSIAFDQPVPILDGNVARVLARVFAIHGNPKGGESGQKFWAVAQEIVTTAAASTRGKLNESLMELGAMVCLPAKPRCAGCPVRSLCVARKTNRINLFPSPSPRPQTQKVGLKAFVIRAGDKFLVRLRPNGEPNAGFWEFPFVQINGGVGAGRALRDAFPDQVFSETVSLGTVSHTIMNRCFLVEAFEAHTVKTKKAAGCRWVTGGEFERLPLSTISRKVLRLVNPVS